MIAVGLALALGSAIGIGGGYALQHASASRLPRLDLRRPGSSLRLLSRSGRWTWGLLAGIAGWGLYVVALRLAPLSLVQAASAGGIGVLALAGGRLSRSERVGVWAAFGGLVLLALSVGSRAPTGRGDVAAVTAWVGISGAAAGVLAWRWRSSGAALGTAAGVLFAAGDVATKAAIVGGERLAFAPVLFACQGVAFVCLQLAFQRGSSLASGGLTVLWTNALPIAAGMALFSEPLPGGVRGGLRIAAFALVLVGGVALSRRSPGVATPEPGIVD